MKLIKELIYRKVPHIIGSYLIAGTSLILFVDWLINRYTLSEYYTTLSLFGVIAIIPSVIILAYFHGAPGKDQWTKIEKIGIPVNIIFIFFVLLIGHRSNWWFEDEGVENNNFYIHLTSTKDYIPYYQAEVKDSPFDKSYSSGRYLIESLPDSLINKIKYSVFRNVSSDYANQKINIDVNFTKEEDHAFDQLFHPALLNLTDSQKDSLSNKIDGIIKTLRNEYDHYDGLLPNTIIRYLIYKITDIETKEIFYTYQSTAQWGESFRTHSSTEYTPWSKDFAIDNEGFKDLIKNLSLAAKQKIKERKFGGAGEVIEELDHGLVRIRQQPGLFKKKMKLTSIRSYVWAEGGLDILIEDYMMYVDYMQNTDLKKQWEYEKSDSLDEWNTKVKIYNKIEYKAEIDKSIKSVLDTIQEMRDQDSGYYENSVGLNLNYHEYYLEVTAVEDSIVIGKIVGSRHPVYNVRKGDWVYISK